MNSQQLLRQFPTVADGGIPYTVTVRSHITIKLRDGGGVAIFVSLT